MANPPDQCYVRQQSSIQKYLIGKACFVFDVAGILQTLYGVISSPLESKGWYWCPQRRISTQTSIAALLVVNSSWLGRYFDNS